MKQNYRFAKTLILIVFMLPGILAAQAIKDSIRKNYTQEKYEAFRLKELRGEVPNTAGPVSSMRSAGENRLEDTFSAW